MTLFMVKGPISGLRQPLGFGNRFKMIKNILLF